MKKLLSLLSVLTISGTAVPTTIAASPYQKEEIKLESNKFNYSQTNNLESLSRSKRQNNNRNVMNELIEYINYKLDALNAESTNLSNWAGKTKAIDFHVYPKINTNSEATFLNTTHSEWKEIQTFNSSVNNYDPNLIIEKSSDIVSKKFTTTHTVSIANTKEINGEVPINFVISKFNLKFANTETTTDTITTETNVQTNPVKIMVKPLHNANVKVEIFSRKKINNYLLSFEVDPDSWFRVYYGYLNGYPITETFNLRDFIINMERGNFNANISENIDRSKNINILNNGIVLKNNKIYINHIPLSDELTEYDFKTTILEQIKI